MTTYASVTYTGDGVTQDFSLTFPYLDEDNIKVFVDGVDTDDVSSLYQHAFQDATTVRVTAISGGAAPGSGEVVKLERVTPISSPDVNFVGGSTIKATNLNTAVKQLLYATQEASDDAENGIRLADDDKFDARSKVIKNVADPVDANDAVNKGYFEGTFEPQLDTKVAAAQAAQTAAEAAQTAAETAKSGADSAQSGAQTAETNASASETAAAASATAAATSSTAASTAQTAAEAALDELTDLYLGAKSLNPTVDNDGNALQDGALYFNTTGKVFRGYDLGTTTWYDADDASASASAAAASQAAAETAKTAAETAQTAAETARTGAETAETNASGSSSAAASSATNAATSESNAAASASAAAGSAASASSSQTNAAASATAAAASASAAATSETNAGTSETNAGTSETNAAASAASAASAATQAVAQARFAAEFPTIQAPAHAWTFYDGVTGTDEIGVTKADTVQTAINKLRLMSTVAANTLNYTHDAETGEPKGFYVHKHVTNLAVDTEDLTAAGWTDSGSPITTLSTTVKSSKSGVFLSEVADDDAGINESRRQIIDLSTFSVGEVLTCSMEMKKTGANRPAFRALIYDTGVNKVLDVVNLPFNEAFPSYDITSAADAYGVEQLGNGVVRAWFTITLPSAVSGTLDYIDMRAFPCWRSDDLGNSSDVTLTGSNHFGNLMVYRGGVLIPYFGGGASQITLGNTFAEATPTTDGLFAAGNRQGTIFIDCDLDWALSNGPFFYLREVYNNGGGFYVRTTTGGVGLQGLIGPVRGDTGIAVRVTPLSAEFSEAMFTGLTMGPMKVAVAWDDDNISMTVNGETVVTRTMNSAFGDTLDSMRFGTFNHNSYNTASAYYRQWAYWPSKLADADLVTLTTL